MKMCIKTLNLQPCAVHTDAFAAMKNMKTSDSLPGFDSGHCKDPKPSWRYLVQLQVLQQPFRGPKMIELMGLQLFFFFYKCSIHTL